MMDEREDLNQKETTEKNIAELLGELVAVQSKIQLVKAALFLNKQRSAITAKVGDLKQYAENQAKIYSQNAQEAHQAIEQYKDAVENAMQEYEASYEGLVDDRNEWQSLEMENITKRKLLASRIKETRSTQEYKDWTRSVKAKEDEIRASASDPDKLTKLAEELKELKSKDPTLQDMKALDGAIGDKKEIKEGLKQNREEFKKLEESRDNKLEELLESKETSLAKIKKQTIWQKIVARFTNKSKKFKTEVVDKIASKAVDIKDNKIPNIKAELSNKRKEYTQKIKDKIKDTKSTVKEARDSGIKAAIEAGTKLKNGIVDIAKGIGSKVSNTKENVKQTLKTTIQESAKKLNDLQDAGSR